MYPAPWSSLPGFMAHDWPRHAGEETIPQVAQSICQACHIHDGDVLVGCSLGGMVACEITKMRRIPAVYLIGSAIRKEEVNPILAKLHPLARATPFDWLRLPAGKLSTESAQMFAVSDPAFVRAMCAAVFQWDGLGDARTQVYRLHGKHDLVIPAPTPADLLLDGGHVISITHARECVEFIKSRLRPLPLTHHTAVPQ